MAGKTENTGGFFLIRWFRGMYQWVMHWADTQYAAYMLGVLSFCESSFFPIPPDVLLIPMAASRPDRAIRFAMITWFTSVFGGMAGYLIGFLFFDSIGVKIIEFYGVMDKYILFREWFEEYNFLIIMTAGLTPLPYKVFTITAGVAEVNFGVFVLGSFMSRGIRFMAEGIVCRYGDYYSRKYLKMSVRELLDKYLEWFMIGMAVLGVAGFLVVKVVLPGSEIRVCQDFNVGPEQQPTKLCLWSSEAENEKHAFDYHLSFGMQGNTIETVIPDGPYHEPSRGEALLWAFQVNKKTVIAAAFFSDLPPPEHGTDGHLVFYLVEDKKLLFLEQRDFQKYRVEEGGAWREGKLEIEVKEIDKKGRTVIIAQIKNIHHAASSEGEESVEEERFHYMLIKNKLHQMGYEKPRAKNPPRPGR